MKNKDQNIEIMCRYCELAEKMFEESIVLCAKHGVVSATGSCRSFAYDPLKRVPPKEITVPKLEYIDIDK